MRPPAIRLDVPAEAEGLRLDRWLADSVDGTSRSGIRRWIESGCVSVDGAPPSKAGLPLRTGMAVVVEPPDPDAGRPEPEAIPLDVLWEDDDLIVVDKPAGMVVHPGHGARHATLVHALLGRGTALAPAGGVERPGIVHRLDRGTSGVLVVAKTDEALRGLAAAFAAREIAKRYLAVVWGHPDPPAGTIERAIGRSRVNPILMTTRGLRGRPRAAITDYATRERLPGFSVLDVDLRTGRTHQIRVHMQSIHHAIVGDDRYGGRAWRGLQDPLKRRAVRSFDRLALHAAELSFAHPRDGRRMRFQAPLPTALGALLDALRRP